MLTFVTSSGARYALNATTSTIEYWNPGADVPITYHSVEFRRPPRVGEAMEFGFLPPRGHAYNPANAPRIFTSPIRRITVS